MADATMPPLDPGPEHVLPRVYRWHRLAVGEVSEGWRQLRRAVVRHRGGGTEMCINSASFDEATAGSLTVALSSAANFSERLAD